MIKKFFKDIYALILGHFTVFKHSFRKRVTLEYPEKRPNLPERFRGKHVWDSTKCLYCKVCEKVCPVNAIHIIKEDNNSKCIIDLDKCIFCGNCQYYCKKSAIKLSKDFELATDNKSTLKFEINTLNSND